MNKKYKPVYDVVRSLLTESKIGQSVPVPPISSFKIYEIVNCMTSLVTSYCVDPLTQSIHLYISNLFQATYAIEFLRLNCFEKIGGTGWTDGQTDGRTGCNT